GGDRSVGSSTGCAETEPGGLSENGDRDSTLDFGFMAKSYAVGDYVWIDSNGNGIQNKGEDPLPGVTVQLLDEDGHVVATTKTDKDGRYLFDGLSAGTYQVKFELTTEQAKRYSFTDATVGKDAAVDSDA